MGKPDLIQSTVLPISDLETNKGQIEGLAKNPRFIRDDSYNKLKRSIAENPEMLAFRECLVFPHEGKYIIIGGNMRYRAQKELGYIETVCKIIPPDTPVETLRAYAIKDNAGFGEWDFDALADDWNPEDLTTWGVDIPTIDAGINDGEAQEDNFNVEDNLPKIAKSKPGDIYRLGKHRLICGNSADPVFISSLMGDSTADLLITDPPYNVNYEEKVKYLAKCRDASLKNSNTEIKNDNLAGADFYNLLLGSFSASFEKTKPGGSFYVFYASVETVNFRDAISRAGFTIKQDLIWNKNHFTIGRMDYQWKHEPILFGWKGGTRHYFTKDRSLATVIEDKLDIDSLSKSELKAMLKELLRGNIPTTVIDEDKPLHSAVHPTMKPIKLIGRFIKNSSRRGETVLDIFGGSGSTMIAAEQLDRICYMIELDPRYCDVTVNRWEELTGQIGEFEGNIFVSENTDTNHK